MPDLPQSPRPYRTIQTAQLQIILDNKSAEYQRLEVRWTEIYHEHLILIQQLKAEGMSYAEGKADERYRTGLERLSRAGQEAADVVSEMQMLRDEQTRRAAQ